MQKTKEELTCKVFLNKKARHNYLNWLIQNKVSPEIAVLLTDCEIRDCITITQRGFFARLLTNLPNKASFNKFNVSLDITNVDLKFIKNHCNYNHYNEVYALLGTL